MKKKLLAVLAAIGLAVGLSVTAAAPAQAFDTFDYYANCPGTATYQQLVVQDYSGSRITVTSRLPWEVYHRFSMDTSPSTIGYVSYAPIEYSDQVSYRFSGTGSLNWYYHVDCFYN